MHYSKQITAFQSNLKHKARNTKKTEQQKVPVAVAELDVEEMHKEGNFTRSGLFQ